MISYSIKLDDREVKRALGGMRDQVPFATALALTKTAFDVRHHIVNVTWPKAISVRSNAFMGRALRVANANKRTLFADVFVDQKRISEKGAKAINQLIDGLPHYPYSSTHLAIPVSPTIVSKTGRLTKRGKEFLNKSNPKTFVADFKGKGLAIWQRMGKGGRARRRLLFVLEPKVNTPKKFGFYRSAEIQARKVWPVHINAAVDKAIRTSFAAQAGFNTSMRFKYQ